MTHDVSYCLCYLMAIWELPISIIYLARTVMHSLGNDNSMTAAMTARVHCLWFITTAVPLNVLLTEWLRYACSSPLAKWSHCHWQTVRPTLVVCWLNWVLTALAGSKRRTGDELPRSGPCCLRESFLMVCMGECFFSGTGSLGKSCVPLINQLGG